MSARGLRDWVDNRFRNDFRYCRKHFDDLVPRSKLVFFLTRMIPYVWARCGLFRLAAFCNWIEESKMNGFACAGSSRHLLGGQESD